jgi:protein-S-isoprenylcysteine O-methyltransferase Ste14
MKIELEPASLIALAALLIGWLSFIFIFMFRKKPSPAPAPARKRDRTSLAGLALQSVSYGVVWYVRRGTLASTGMFDKAGRIALAIVTLALVVGSIWIMNAAVRTLGKEWSLSARLVDEHRLVTEGAYRLARHPIYTGMLGMLLATGLAFSRPLALLFALLIFGVGTIIRVRSEEKLLREAFGAEYDAYAKRVPAILPFLI